MSNEVPYDGYEHRFAPAPRFPHVPPQRPRAVPCPLAFVGEAPADVEIESGIPLSGPSGGVFNRILRAADLSRADFLVTNVFDFKLEQNDVRSITRPGVGDDPQFAYGDRHIALEHRYHLKRLGAEIAAAKPAVIVPMGGTAVWAFTGNADIGRARGAVSVASRLAAVGTKIVPTYHPSHVIKDWRLFHVVVNDILKALRESEFPERPPQHRRREIWISPNLFDLNAFYVKHISACTTLSVDIETMRGQISCIGFAPDPEHAIVVPFVDTRRPSFNYWPNADLERQALAWVRKVLTNDSVKLFQNGMYDVTWIWDKWRIPVRNYSADTRLLHHALYCELPKDLAFMGACYAEAPPWKLMRPWYNAGGEKKDE